MPQRTREHVIADRATRAVEKLIADAGFAGEPVKSDYGEDILVQTSHGSVMDASRLWIQVKGSENLERFRRRTGDLSCPIPTPHLLRWVRSADPVVVVLWDVERGRGYFAHVPDIMRVLDETPAPTPKTQIVTFPQTQVFDIASVGRLAWDSRMQRSQGLLLEATAREGDAEVIGVSKAPAQEMRVQIALDLLEVLDLVEHVDARYRLTPLGKEMYESRLRAVWPSDAIGDVGETDKLAFILWATANATFMDRVSEVGGVGVYREHMLVVSPIIMSLFGPPDDIYEVIQKVREAARLYLEGGASSDVEESPPSPS